MAQVSLMEYLQHGLPQYTVPPHLFNTNSPNTRNGAYSDQNIISIADWPEFNIGTMPPVLLNVLFNARIQPDFEHGSPPRVITAESILRDDLSHNLTPHVKRSLRCAFDFMHQANQMAGLTFLSFGIGEEALQIGRFTPDTAYFDLHLQPEKGPNRAPGEIKPSWKWNRAMQFSALANSQVEFHQALSQVKFYMTQHGAKYGFVLTDRSFTAIKRTQMEGELKISEEIPLTRTGTAEHPEWTVLLAMWYLGMLAAQDDHWQL